MSDLRGSLLWRYAGDWRAMLPGPSAGLMQLLYPPLGAGVAEHSAFFTEPFERIYRSIPQIWATIFEPDAATRGRALRDLHKHIKGVDADGHRYHALDPETFWWAHATFTWEIFRSVDLFHPGSLGEREQEQLYQETLIWYSRYGVSDRPAPATYPAFKEKFRQVCAEALERTAAADQVIEMAQHGRVSALPVGPPFLAAVAGPVITPALRLVLVGCLPALLRRRFAIPWTTANRLEFRALAMLVAAGLQAVPAGINRSTLQTAQRRLGAATRSRRFQPAA